MEGAVGAGTRPPIVAVIGHPAHTRVATGRSCCSRVCCPVNSGHLRVRCSASTLSSFTIDCAHCCLAKSESMVCFTTLRGVGMLHYVHSSPNTNVQVQTAASFLRSCGQSNKPPVTSNSLRIMLRLPRSTRSSIFPPSVASTKQNNQKTKKHETAKELLLPRFKLRCHKLRLLILSNSAPTQKFRPLSGS
jgi:hypothetical protein